MEANQLMLLFQLITRLDENVKEFERGYNLSEKEKFDSSKKAILELHKKIDFLLK